MVNYILIIPILVTFIVTLFLVPNWIKRAKKAGLVGKDVHKLKQKDIAESGGVTVVAGFAIGVLTYVAINTFIIGSSENFVEIFALMSTILLISFIAFTDDILGWKIGLRRKTRLILVAFASIPLIAINAGRSTIVLPFFGVLELGAIYPLILIPIGIIGATSTFNFLAGFNGLEAGNGIIVLSALAIVSFFTGSFWLFIVNLCMVASLIAFLIFNYTPAKIFGGDSLTYVVGGLIAITAILGDFERIAIFFFIPFIIETILKVRGGLVKESFGKLNEDGSLSLRYDKIYSLNHISIHLMEKINIKSTEKRVVFSIWLFQIIIIILGFAIFRGGLF